LDRCCFPLTLVAVGFVISWLRKNISHEDNLITRVSKRIYRPLLAKSLAHPKIVAAVAVGGIGHQLGSCLD